MLKDPFSIVLSFKQKWTRRLLKIYIRTPCTRSDLVLIALWTRDVTTINIFSHLQEEKVFQDARTPAKIHRK